MFSSSPARSVRVLAAMVLLAALPACRRPGSAPRSMEEACQSIPPLPAPPYEVWSLAPGEPAPVKTPAACAQPMCLQAENGVLAVADGTGHVFAAWDGQPGRVMDARAAPAADAPAPERLAYMLALKGTASTAPPRRGPASGLAPPELPPELRTCGQTYAGGGVGWHVIRNQGDIWQRVHWAVPPTAPDVLALPVDAYPLHRLDGTLCGHAVQRRPRHWVVHVAGTSVTQDAEADQEHPPARCTRDGVRVNTDEGWVVLGRDGAVLRRGLREATAPATGAAPPPQRLHLDGSAVLTHDAAEVEVETAHGRRFALNTEDPLRDLAGAPVPPGTRRQRLSSSGDGMRHVLVAERLALPSCRIEERLHMVDTETRTVTTVTRGEHLHMRLTHAAGRFHWVQARPQSASATEGGTLVF